MNIIIADCLCPLSNTVNGDIDPGVATCMVEVTTYSSKVPNID